MLATHMMMVKHAPGATIILVILCPVAVTELSVDEFNLFLQLLLLLLDFL